VRGIWEGFYDAGCGNPDARFFRTGREIFQRKYFEKIFRNFFGNFFR